MIDSTGLEIVYDQQEQPFDVHTDVFHIEIKHGFSCINIR